MRRLFSFSALLMTTATALLSWFYGIVNGKEIEYKERSSNGQAPRKTRSGGTKGE